MRNAEFGLRADDDADHSTEIHIKSEYEHFFCVALPGFVLGIL